MPINREQIVCILRKNKNILLKRFNVERIGLFGSYADNTQKPDSDIDIIVEGKNIKEEELREMLEKEFNAKVDVVKESTLYNFMKYLIKKEAVYA
jgi:hypothetical protein